MKEIDKLRKEIYSKQGSVRSRPRDRSQIDPRPSKDINLDKQELLEKMRMKKGQEITRKQKRRIIMSIIGILILIIFLGLGYAYFIYQESKFSQENVILEIDAIPNVESGETFTFNILYHNNNQISLENPILKVDFKDSMEILKVDKDPQDIGTDYINFDLEGLNANENGSIKFEAKIIEKEKTTNYINSQLVYEIRNGKEQYSQKIQKGITVSASKVDLDFESTRQGASGDLIEYFLKIKNNTKTNIDGAEIRITYPDSFSFSSSTVNPMNDQNNVFKLPTLIPKEVYEVSIKGIIQGSSAHSKKAVAKIGIPQGEEFQILAQEETVTDIVTSPLIIDQRLSDQNVDPGSPVEVKIDYYNSSDIPMTEAVVTVDLKGRVIDYGSLQIFNGGQLDQNRSKIIWRAGNNQELKVLEPQERGTLTFRLRASSMVPSKNFEDKNFEIVSIAQIDSPDVPTPVGINKLISSNRKVIKVNSKVIFETKAFYNDNVIPNNGPVPPKVGKETTYTIHWIITNVNNDLEGVYVKTTLPEYMEWEDVVFPYDSQDNLKFNERTNEIVWEIGNLSAFVGTQLDVKEVIFQVALTPQQHHLYEELDLIGKSFFYAKDVFTQKEYNLESIKATTALTYDTGVDYTGAEVQPSDENIEK
ncbi:MAG: hypothetical protein GF335_03790 [Candidatus Moranbacteria bacterium]|nr:hypothetical protein [Candidatus Moranbacteria bacterium]